MDGRKAVIGLCLCATIAFGKGYNGNQLRDLELTKAQSSLMPAEPELVLAQVKPPRPYHLTIAADPSVGATSYRIYVKTNGAPSFTRFISNSVPQATVSNLWPNTSYAFTMSALNSVGESPDAVPFIVWPWATTNFVALGWSGSTNGAWTTNSVMVNPGDLTFWRGLRLTNAIALQTSTNRLVWSTLTNWTMTPSPVSFYLRQARWNNQGGYAFPD